MKFKTLNKLSNKGIEEILKYGTLVEDDEEAIIVRSFDMHEMELNEKVLSVARAGAGVNNIPLDKFAEKGVVVFNTPGANSNAVKELTLCGLLIAARDVVGGVNWTKENKDLEGLAKAVEKNKSKFAGGEIYQKNILIIGLGVIGVKVANACCALGMNVYGYDPYLNVKNALKLDKNVEYITTYEELLGKVDYISVHVPLNPYTKEMINDSIFTKVKPGVKLLNFSRGELVNEADLQKAIENNIISKYVTDFPNNNVANMPNVIAIPHLGASTEEAEDICAEMAVKQTKDYIDLGIIVNSVNYPECILGKKACENRVTILYKNEEDLYANIQEILKEIKSKEIVMKTNNKYGYIVIECDVVEEGTINRIKELQNVYKVRVI